MVKPDSKVLFRVISEEDGSVDIETLWATCLGNDTYRLNNSPFYAYSVSWEDIVYAPFSEQEGFPTFLKTISKSGNRTIRIAFEQPVDDANAVLKNLAGLGCTYEGASRRMISLNIPPDVELEEICDLLRASKVTWEYADPAYKELFPWA